VCEKLFKAGGVVDTANFSLLSSLIMQYLVALCQTVWTYIG